MSELFSVQLAGNTMTIQVTSTSTPEVISRLNVVDAVPVDNPNAYGVSPEMMTAVKNWGVRVLLKSSTDGGVLGGPIIPMNVDDQAGWTNDQAGQTQCIADIQAWL